MKKVSGIATLAWIALLTAGCDTTRDELVALSRESQAQQARQNARMAAQSQQIAEASQRLVAADAESRREFVKLVQSQEAQRAAIDRDRTRLDDERKEIARLRHRDATLAAVLESATLLFCAALPLALCDYIVWCLGRQPKEAARAELLLVEVTSPQPRLLSTLAQVGQLPHPKDAPAPADEPGSPE